MGEANDYFSTKTRVRHTAHRRTDSEVYWHDGLRTSDYNQVLVCMPSDYHILRNSSLTYTASMLLGAL
jgi:hypothetical protein